ncbi:MAG: hypothetical protein KC451_05440 [Amylibacter sp.]|jgi:hypothetical protein|nr:hypothetical protein [Amylibacter sp.]
MNTLDEALLAAHLAGDNETLVGLYRAAGEAVLARDEVQGCFYLTHAYVFALEAGMAEAEELRAVLVARGREA